jgi:hypothetical protein
MSSVYKDIIFLKTEFSYCFLECFESIYSSYKPLENNNNSGPKSIFFLPAGVLHLCQL